MYQGKAGTPYCTPMRQRAVAFMFIKMVRGICLWKMLHEPVPRHFGDDRSKGNCGNCFVPTNERGLFPARGHLESRVEKYLDPTRGHTQARDGDCGSLMRRLHDTYRINNIRINERTCMLQATVRDNALVQNVALLCGQLF